MAQRAQSVTDRKVYIRILYPRQHHGSLSPAQFVSDRG